MPRRRRKRTQQQHSSAPPPPEKARAPRRRFYEVDAVAGLEEVTYSELRQRLGKRVQFKRAPATQARASTIVFTYAGHPGRLLDLKTVLNVYLVRRFDVARPAALQAAEPQQALVEDLKLVRGLHPLGAIETLGIGAAGADSPVMIALRDTLAERLSLVPRSHDIDLLVRLRRAADGSDGWDALTRLSPRPLSVRAWRVSDMKGALNGAVAHAMVLLTRPKADDKFLNLAAGSGTLLVERALAGSARRLIGCDIDRKARDYAQANLAAAGMAKLVELHDWDVGALNLPDASVDAICADPPYGLAVGSHQQNLDLYPRMLVEAARVARPGARFVLITQEVRMMDDLLRMNMHWSPEQVLEIELRGLHPRIYVLKRTRG